MGGKNSGRKKMPIPEHKVCTWCHQVLTPEKFYKPKSRGYTLSQYCITCDKEVSVLYSIKRRMKKHGVEKINAELSELMHDIERRQMILNGQFDEIIACGGNPVAISGKH